MNVLVLVIEPYTKAANAAASVWAFPWMGPKSTTCFILIVRSFTCHPNHDIIIYNICIAPYNTIL